MRILLSLMLLLGAGASQATPDFRAVENVQLSEMQGQVVYLDFWASWCVPCRLSFPWLIETQEKFRRQGLTVLAVNVDAERPDAESFLRGQATNFPIVLDPQGQLAERYQIAGMPSAVLIGRDGQILQRHTGFREKDKPELEAAIRAALHAGAPQ